jgi:hypothetical protein
VSWTELIFVWIHLCKSDFHQFWLFGWFESKLLLNMQLPKWALIIFYCIKDNYLNLIKKLILEQNVLQNKIIKPLPKK